VTSTSATKPPRRATRPPRRSSRPPRRKDQQARAARVAKLSRRRAAEILVGSRTAWRRRLLVGGIAIGVSGGVALVVWLFWFSSLLAVSSVRAVGVEGAAANAVLSAADVPIGVPLARLDAAAASLAVRQLPWVASVEVRRGWPHDVVVAAVPKVAIATLSSGESVSADGSVYTLPPGAMPVTTTLVSGDATASEVGATLPTVTAKDDALVAAMGAYSSLPADLAGRVKAITATTRDNVDLALRGGAVVHWGSAEQAIEKAQVLRSLLRHRADIYDVTSPELPTMWKRG